MMTGPTTEQALREAEDRDAGRGLSWGWVQPEVGAQFVSLTALANDALAPGGAKTSGFGPLVGLGAGVRLLFFTVGVSGRMTFLPDGIYTTAHLEGSYRIPLGNLEPYGFLSTGYATVLGMNAAGAGVPSNFSIHGWSGRVGGGVDYYLTPVFSVGAAASFEVMWLRRGALSNAALATADASVDTPLRKSGHAAGLATGITAVCGVHF